MHDSQFNFYLQTYVNDIRLAEALFTCPEEVPHIDPDVLRYEMEWAWERMEELIPQSHIDAIQRL